MGKEGEKVKKRIDKITGEILTQGIWEDGTRWTFVLSNDRVDPKLCTAAFCVTTFKGSILLTEHSTRGWEIPGGHVDLNEDPLETVIREVTEETGAIIKEAEIFGYKVITSEKPIPKKDQPGQFYPFPHSYVSYFFSEAVGRSNTELAPDVIGVRVATFAEARELLARGHNHDVLIKYLHDTARINLI